VRGVCDGANSTDRDIGAIAYDKCTSEVALQEVRGIAIVVGIPKIIYPYSDW